MSTWRIAARAGLIALITSSGCGDNAGPPRFVDAGAADCSARVAGPITPEVFVSGLGAAEDLAFDGAGGFAAVGDDGLVRVDGAGRVAPLATSEALDFVAGLRYAPDGRLIALEFIRGRVRAVAPDGGVSLIADGLSQPNAVAPAAGGDLFVSETSGDRIVRISPSGEVDAVATGGLVTAANGVVYDEGRRSLFFAAGLGGDVMTVGRIDFDDAGAAGEPVEVYVGDPGNGDGMALDACGDLYVVDSYRAGDGDPRRLVRLPLDAGGASAGPVEVIAEFPESVTNPAFGFGPGFDPLSVYVTGFAGIVYRVPVGVSGARTR